MPSRFTLACCFVTVAGCHSHYLESPDASARRCVPTIDGGTIANVELELPTDATLPLSSDLVVRGTVRALPNVVVFKVLVAGIPANHDGADFTSFDATVPLAALQAEAATAADPTTATVDVAVITDCDPAPITVRTVTVKLRAVTNLTLAVEAPAPGYVPNAIAVTPVFDLTANAEAAGVPLTIATSQGTVSGPSVLPGDGVTQISTRVFLTPDPTKQGLAEVTVQAAAESGHDSVLIVGPPTLTPQTASIVRGGPELEVLVRNTLPVTEIPASIAGCAAGVTPGIEVHVGPNDISGAGLTKLTATDSLGNPIFRVDALVTATASSTITVTCFDVYGQSVIGTYTAI